MTRGRPALLDDLPDQVFTAMLAASARAAAEPGPRLIDLGRGNPDLPPPAVALDAVREAMRETATPAVHGYPPFQGQPALREAIAAHYAAEHGVAIDPETEVAVLPGTKTGIMLAALATAGRGDGVLLPDPGYPDYRSGVALAGAREVAYPLDPSAGHQPDLEAIGAAEREGAALLVLNFPSNPAAVCAAPGTFEAAVAYAHRHISAMDSARVICACVSTTRRSSRTTRALPRISSTSSPWDGPSSRESHTVGTSTWRRTRRRPGRSSSGSTDRSATRRTSSSRL